MLPSELRLLAGVRNALKAAIGADPASKMVGLISAAVVGVDELILRADTGFWAQYHRKGVSLLEAGMALARLDTKAIEDPQKRLAPAFEAVRDSNRRSEQIDQLMIHLTVLVDVLGAKLGSNPATADYLSKVIDWENELHAHRLQQAAQSTLSGDAPGARFTKQALQKYFRDKRPQWREVVVADVKTLPGGFSKSTVLVDLVSDDLGSWSVVIRAEQPVTLVFFDGARIENEYWVLRMLHRRGVKVPEPLWLESDIGFFGAKFLVSAKAEGQNIGTAISVNRDVPEALLVDLIDNLVSVHRIPIESSDEDVVKGHLALWQKFSTLSESAHQHVRYWREQVHLMNLPASPIIHRTLDWLANNVPESNDSPSLIHRDYGLHNILIKDDLVTCILDWEGATIGDPAEDLAWMTDSMKGKVDRQRMLDLYAKASGNIIPAERLRFYDVFTSLKYAVTCSQALTLFENYPAVPIVACQLGLLYPYHGTAALNGHLRAAENFQ